MAYRPHAGPFPVLNSTTGQSMAGNLTSLVTIIQDLSMPSYGISWTGTSPVGAVSVQVSNDYSLNADGTVKNAGSWNTMYFSYNGTGVASVPVTGNTGSGFLDITRTSGYAIRLIYTATSGVGTISAVMNAKVS